MSDEPWREAEVKINGHQLTVGQVMALRVAASQLHTTMVDGALGPDEHGRRMVVAYRNRLEEVLLMLTRGAAQ
jgi:hypothetical protein